MRRKQSVNSPTPSKVGKLNGSFTSREKTRQFMSTSSHFHYLTALRRRMAEPTGARAVVLRLSCHCRPARMHRNNRRCWALFLVLRGSTPFRLVVGGKREYGVVFLVAMALERRRGLPGSGGRARRFRWGFAAGRESCGSRDRLMDGWEHRCGCERLEYRVK